MQRNKKLEKKKTTGRKKKDNSSKDDYFLNCRCCAQVITNDYRAQYDKRYCRDCL